MVTTCLSKVVLVVEDDIVTAKFFRRVLESQQYSVHLARDCQSARTLTLEHSFSLIFVDLMLPDGDGLELIREFRGRPELAGLPIIMCTACEHEQTFSQAFAAGASDFIRKPCRPTELLVRASNALRLQEAQLKVVALQQNKTMVSMASLVAHEINNPLAAAYHFLNSLNARLPDDGESKHDYRMLSEVLDRIRTLVADMRTVALVDESAESFLWLSESLRIVCRILNVRNSKGTWVRSIVDQDSQVRAHPGLQAQALVGLGNYWLDLVEQLGGGGLELTARLNQGHAQVTFSMQLNNPPDDSMITFPLEPAEVVLARRQVSRAGSTIVAGVDQGGLPTLTIHWPPADKMSVALRKETPVS